MDTRSYQANYLPHIEPPPPPVFDQHGLEMPSAVPDIDLRCNMCDTNQHVSIRSMKKTYLTRWIFLAFFFLPIISLLLIFVLRVQHEINLSFCDNCWKRFRKAIRFDIALGIVEPFLLIGGLMVATYIQSITAFCFFWGLAFGLLIFNNIKRTKNSPKVKKLDRKQVIISTASGDLVFVK